MTPTASTQPPGQSGVLHLYRELWRFAAGQRLTLLGAFGLLIAAQVLLLGVPYLSGRALNVLQLQGVDGLRQAGFWLLLILAVTAFSWLLHGPGRMLERNVALLVRRRLSTELLERLTLLPLAWHEAHHSGATSHRVQQSTHALADFTQSQFIYLNSAVRLVGPIVALSLLAPIIGGTAVLGFVAISVSVLGFDRLMIRLAQQENAAERRYAAALIDALGNTTTLFALRQARSVNALLLRRLLLVFELLKRSIVFNEAKWCTVDVASKALSCALVALYAWLSLRGAPGEGPRPEQLAAGAKEPLLLGHVYMVWEYAQQAGGVISAVAAHFQTFARQQADYASADVIREAAPAHFAEPSTRGAATDAAAQTGPRGDTWQRLHIGGLTFRHAANRTAAPTLDGLTFALARGKRYALIGGSGSGKSTLLRILAGLYGAERIQLTLDQNGSSNDGVQAARLLRTMTTLIPQDAEVFEGTLEENLSLCESVAGVPSPQDYPRALQLARVTDFIPATPAGMQTLVAERAANWSGGQRSRVALARGILAAQGSTLVLLDEPTASLDPVTEASVYDNLFAAFSEACIVSSVHRLNLLERFDEILVMQAGQLVAQGTVAELSARSAEFRQLLSQHGGS